MDVLELLKRDHQAVTKLFQRFHGSQDRNRRSVAEKICKELEVHTQVEEELFYPVIRGVDQELERLVEEAVQDHQRVSEQIQTVRAHMRQEGGDEGDLETLMTSIEQDVEHHVIEEEGEIFPRVEEKLDDRRRSEMGTRAEERKRALLGEERRPKTSRRASSRKTKQRRGARAKQARRGGKRATARKTKSGGAKKQRARGGRGR